VSKQPNKTAIGAFVVGAIALTIGALIIFGSGNSLKTKEPLSCFLTAPCRG
jgi:hypothetical protein